MIVMKFGGAALADSSRIKQTAKIIGAYQKKEPVILVVSAVQGVTDKLIEIVSLWKNHNITEALIDVSLLYQEHLEILINLQLNQLSLLSILSQVNKLYLELLNYISQLSFDEAKEKDYVISYGEKFSSVLVWAQLEHASIKSIPINSADIIVTSGEFGNAKLILSQTKKQIQAKLFPLLDRGITPIVTGFFGASRQKHITVLGRGGSDYSATIIANALSANAVILWKEVDGVFDKDPKKHLDAFFYQKLSYQHALDLAQKGAKILHPKAMLPVQQKNIPVHVKNFHHPELQGTTIWKSGGSL